jgi:hypothetical protein
MTDPAPPAPATGYQQPQPYAPYGAGPNGVPLGPRTNALAIVALVLGLTVPLGGIICGHLALGQIRRTGEAGHGLAVAGLVLGYVLTGLTVLYIIGMIAVLLFSFGTVATTVSTIP